LTTLKMAVVAPVPSPAHKIAVTLKTGFRASMRKP
jgi:hypothetical protein